MRLMNILVWCSLVMVMSVGSLGSVEARVVADLKQYQWRNRLLLLFSPSPEVPPYRAFLRELEEQTAGVRERDLLVFHVMEQGKSFLDRQKIPSAEARALRQRFGIGPGIFTVVLVGKDGGVKLQQSGAVALSDIFGLIDSMPMRQQERQKQE